MNKHVVCFAAFLLALIPSGLSAQTLAVDASVVDAHVSPFIYGACIEDVNHEIYGGLYDQRIFGEGFEEPPVTVFEDVDTYDGRWTVKVEGSKGQKGQKAGESLQLLDTNGKFVCRRPAVRKGTVSVEVRLEGANAIGGLILDVSDAGKGLDAFNGYEIALDAAKGDFVFGKHSHDWQPIARFAARFDRHGWNRLRVRLDGSTFTCYLGRRKVFTYTDTVAPLSGSLVGLRSVFGTASFRRLKVNGTHVPFRLSSSRPVGLSQMWDAVGSGTYVHDGDRPFTGRYAQCISGRSGCGIANRGLNRWGISVVERQPMHTALYLRGKPSGHTPLRAVVALQRADGAVEYARAGIEGITDTWQRFEADLLPTATDPDARFVLLLADDGTLWADQVLLATDAYPFRRDLTDAFRACGLTIMRYGGTMVNASDYLTRRMTGSRLEREPYLGHWYRHSTNGFAIPEFVEFTRCIGAEPAFAINIEDDPADVLRLLEEIKPFAPRLLEIGNEECIGTRSRAAYEHYVERFLLFYEAIHPVWPAMEFVNAAWWRPDELETMAYVFHALDGKAAYWDYHPWTETPAQAAATEPVIRRMQQLFHTWNPATTMRCAIFEENGNTHDMARALAHAVMLNVVRRTDGFVPYDSPANALQPWRQNDNGWDQGQIFFDASRTWMQPPYYAQQMAAANHQPLLVHTEVADNPTDSLDVTVTRNAAGDTLVVHAVNYALTPRTLTLSLSGFAPVSEVKVLTLAGAPDARNLPTDPQHITTHYSLITNPSLPLSSYSYSVFILTP